jgi:hypothetical protein
MGTPMMRITQATVRRRSVSLDQTNGKGYSGKITGKYHFIAICIDLIAYPSTRLVRSGAPGRLASAGSGFAQVTRERFGFASGERAALNEARPDWR